MKGIIVGTGVEMAKRRQKLVKKQEGYLPRASDQATHNRDCFLLHRPVALFEGCLSVDERDQRLVRARGQPLSEWRVKPQ